jgi:hypothetical protein
MINNQKLLISILTLMGIIPFALLSLLSWYQNYISIFYISINSLILCYAAVIISFISGIYWG